MLRKIKLFAALIFAITAYGCAHPVLAQSAWKITKTQWSAADEKNFEGFVQRLGEAVEKRQCRNVKDCLKSAANTYRQSDPSGLALRADCADFPYFIRGYFAWKNGLPFSFATEMKRRDVKGNGGDLRYSRYGNQVEERYDAVAKNGFPNALEIFNNLIPDMTSSANYRINFEGNDEGLFADHYPVAISRESIRPGTVLYDPDGHVVLVFRVTDDGRVFYFDAHPDNSLTSGFFGIKFVRSHPGQGAGFKNWRPLKLVGATQDSQGYYIGGKIVAATNSQIADYGIEQFFGSNVNTTNDWSKALFVHNGKTVSYYEYVRLKLAVGELRLNPVDEFKNLIGGVCESLKDRVLAVDISIKAGLQNKRHPERLPDNIYGTQGEWETYSSPSRDAQLKVSYHDLVNQAKDFITKWKSQDPSIVYGGSNLALELADVYKRESTTCEITYTNSNGNAVTLNLDDIRQRLFKISFDPYHCVEYRWGANDQELATCQDDSNKRLWYEREQRLRNQHLRRYDVRMDFSLDELLQPLPGHGTDVPPDVDVLRYLQSQGG